MAGREMYGEVAAANALNEQVEAIPFDQMAALQTSVELGVRSILFYAVELMGLKDAGEASVGKVEGEDIEYEVVVRCKKKSKIIVLGR